MRKKIKKGKRLNFTKQRGKRQSFGLKASQIVWGGDDRNAKYIPLFCCDYVECFNWKIWHSTHEKVSVSAKFRTIHAVERSPVTYVQIHFQLPILYVGYMVNNNKTYLNVAGEDGRLAGNDEGDYIAQGKGGRGQLPAHARDNQLVCTTIRKLKKSDIMESVVFMKNTIFLLGWDCRRKMVA